MNEIPSPLLGPTITKIFLVERYDRMRESAFETFSLPGHLIQYVVRGRVEQRSSGMKQVLTPGSAIWYHESESVTGKVLKSPWIFYSVGFSAPTLHPPSWDHRVMRAAPGLRRNMERLLKLWKDPAPPSAGRHLRLHAVLHEIILSLLPEEAQACRMDADADAWWRVENELREDLSRPVSLNILARMAHVSPRTLNRSCRLSVGLTPMKRVKLLRLRHARGLVHHSDYNMTEIAGRIGYPRVQEFSRDYSAAFSVSPLQDRRNRRNDPGSPVTIP